MMSRRSTERRNRMERGKKGNGGGGAQTHKDKTINKSQRTNNNKKGGWSHIIDKVDYSSGPGDNIYVFG